VILVTKVMHPEDCVACGKSRLPWPTFTSRK